MQTDLRTGHAMTYLTGFLPDLHIVSDLDLLLLQREAAAGHPATPTATPSPPWPSAALDSVLDELDRRDACPVEHRMGARGRRGDGTRGS